MDCLKNINIIKFIKSFCQNIPNSFIFATNSINKNYKSWLVLLISVVIISFNDLSNGMLTFLFTLFASHLFHYSCHLALYTNSVHLYHHTHNNYLSHLSQMILEFFSILFFIFSKHLFNWSFLNEWIIFFYYFFYTTVHNVNYSIFHVNKVHENHHKLLLLNLGPDICDILFQTKFDLPDGIENTDHYLWNIVFGLILILMGKVIWKNATDLEKNGLINIFVAFYGIIVITLAILTVYFNFIN
jgi:hypothetical protein